MQVWGIDPERSRPSAKSESLFFTAISPSRAVLMTGQYSIRNGLSLVVIPNTPNTLSAGAFTVGDMFHELGYSTAIFGKWHLGKDPQSLPTAHGFDEFYGIPPDMSWDSATCQILPG
jgi:arylsulfatase A-like enzyme